MESREGDKVEFCSGKSAVLGLVPQTSTVMTVGVCFCHRLLSGTNFRLKLVKWGQLI